MLFKCCLALKLQLVSISAGKRWANTNYFYICISSTYIFAIQQIICTYVYCEYSKQLCYIFYNVYLAIISYNPQIYIPRVQNPQCINWYAYKYVHTYIQKYKLLFRKYLFDPFLICLSENLQMIWMHYIFLNFYVNIHIYVYQLLRWLKQNMMKSC